MAMNKDFEVAPVGTRELLRELAKSLRSYEGNHRDKVAAAYKELERTDLAPVSQATERAVITAETEKADSNARWAGRVEALLAGWEE